MNDIFLSYAHEDAERIVPLVHVLEAQGWTVFWDRRIPAGQTWRSYIGQALANAKCVVVAWSAASIHSDWVAEEADDAKARRVLVPVLLDDIQPPMGFRSIQAANLAGWEKDAQSPRLDRLIADISVILKVPPPAAGALPRPVPASKPTPVGKRLPWINWGIAAAVIGLAGGGIAYLSQEERVGVTSPATPAITDQGATTSEVTRKPTGLYGTTGAPVVLVQGALRAQGYEKIPLDGNYGPQTRYAVKDFQEKHGLEPTGELDTATASAIIKLKPEGN